MGALSVKGDFAELRAFAEKLKGMKKVVPQLAKEAAPQIEAKINDAARAGLDPYGDGFEPRNDGGAAYASVSGSYARARARGLQLVASVTRKIPRYMNRGRSAEAKGGFMPARLLVPESDAAPVPETWTEVLEETAERLLDDKAVR